MSLTLVTGKIVLVFSFTQLCFSFKNWYIRLAYWKIPNKNECCLSQAKTVPQAKLHSLYASKPVRGENEPGSVILRAREQPHDTDFDKLN